MIGEKEFKVINEVRRGSVITQREISQKTGFSLGLTNILLKKLIQKGYIKITKPNRRSLQYFLTPRGIAEVAERSYQYFFRTIRSLKEIRTKIQTLLLEEYKKGRRNFVVLGDGELADLTEIALRDLGKKDITYSKHPHLLPSSPLPPGERIRGEGIGKERGKDALFLLADSKQRIKDNKVSSLDILKEIANFL